jgi:prepilin-type N-terminal cleavage/methylation domain-containing protein
MHKKDEKGFTLIELMIVIAIIGILAAIAIPQFNAYRARSYNASANTDIRNLMTSCEGYFVDFDTYPTTADPATDLANYGYVQSTGVADADIDGNATAYTIADVYNTKAGDKAVTYSVTGPGGEIDKDVP